MPKEDVRGESPAVRLIDLIWRHEGHGKGRSWHRLERVCADGAELAIRYGLRFDIDDFSAFMDRYAFDHWPGSEEYYTLACDTGFGPNVSACLAWERFKKRAPFIYADPANLSGRRLAVSSQFTWDGKQVHCTSFSEDGVGLVAVVTTDRSIGPAKVLRRYRITLADLRRHNRDVRRLCRPATSADKPEDA